MAACMHSIPDAALTSTQSPGRPLAKRLDANRSSRTRLERAWVAVSGVFAFARSSGNTANWRGDEARSDCAAKACRTRSEPLARSDPSRKPATRRFPPFRTRADAKLRRRSSVNSRGHAKSPAHGPDRDQSRRAAEDGDAVIRAHGFGHERNDAPRPGQFAYHTRSSQRGARNIRNDDGASGRAKTHGDGYCGLACNLGGAGGSPARIRTHSCRRRPVSSSHRRQSLATRSSPA